MKLKLFTGALLLIFNQFINAQSVDTVFTTQNSGISYNIVNAVYGDNENRLFIGTEYGLSFYENDVWQIWRDDNSSISENTIRTLYKDAKNQLWVGGFRNFPSVINDGELAEFPLPDELSNHVKDILLVQQQEEEVLYLATESGLGIYNVTNQKWEIINLSSVYVESPNFTSLAYNKDIGLCAGTLNGGLVIVRNNDQVETYFGEGTIPDNTILDVAIDENNLIWMASPAGGLITFNGTNFESITPFNSDIHSEFISCLTLVNSKEIWFGTNTKGIGHFKEGEFSHFDTYNSKLLSDKINDLHLQNDSILWAATDVGLAKICLLDKLLPTSIYDVSSNLIYPNPTSNKINIKQQFYDEVLIYNSEGQIVFQSNAFLQQVEIAHLKTGIYYVTIKLNDIVSVNKLNIL